MRLILFVLLILAIVPGFSSVAPGGPVGTELPWQEHELGHVKKSHAELISSGRHEYAIEMAGNVDMDHALTREYARWRVGWQPNESLIIENVGTTLVENCKVIINERGDWYSMEGLLREAIGSAKSEQEKAYLIWQFLRKDRHHDDPLYEGRWGDELHDPVKMLVIYGAGLCDDSGSIGASVFAAAGLNQQKPFVRSLHGHMMCEVFAENRYQFMDIDENVFYLDRENSLPVGGDVIVRDHDLAHREIHYGPIFNSWQRSQSAASLFGRDDGKTTRLTQGYKVRVNLRPAERIEYRWDNIGKWSMRQPHRQRRWVGNSRKIYKPSLSSPKAGAEKIENVSFKTIDGRPVAAGDDAKASLLYRMNSAFVFCGGRVQAEFHLQDAADQAAIDVWAIDNKGSGKTEPVTLWQAKGAGTKQANVEIDKAINPTEGRPEYEYWVRVRLISNRASGGAALTKLTLRGDIMVSPIFLPRLRLGTNKVVYTDGSQSGRKVRVTYNWRETTATKPLPAPKLLYPPDNQTIRDEIVTYKWQPVAEAVAYHLQVSRDPSFRWPYRPSLDVVYKGTQYANPFWGIYNCETDYYWQVRAQNDKGIWGDWSKARTFRWQGPHIPVEVKLTKIDGRFVLSWKPNRRGEQPSAYEVYGSDIKGFSVHKEAHEIATLGKVSGNYLGRTMATRIEVAGVFSDNPVGVENQENLNRCYYRVVAVDAEGAHSGCSDYAEMPHPIIISLPVVKTSLGERYRYQPKVIRSLGDLQHRYEKPVTKFWEQEQLRFSLEKGPDWLSMDSKTGLLTGTPSAANAAKHRVRIGLTTSFEKRTGKDKFSSDLPDKKSYQDYSLTVFRSK